MKIIVDIGGTNIRVGTDLHSKNMPLLIYYTPSSKEKIIELLTTSIAKILNQYKPNKITIIMSVPGLVTLNGVVEKSLYLDIDNINFKQLLSKTFDCDVIVENDANIQALGCYKKSSLLYLVIGTAIGGAYIDSNGKIFKGENGFACEFGHVFSGGERICYCGRKGCLDTIASGNTMIDLFGEQWWLQNNNRYINRYMHFCGERVANALDRLAIVFDPKDIVICGHICQNDYFLSGLYSNSNSELLKKKEMYVCSDTWSLIYNASINYY